VIRKPIFYAVRVKVVLDIARQRRHHIFVSEIAETYRALILVFKYGRLILKPKELFNYFLRCHLMSHFLSSVLYDCVNNAR